jgi:hypothetical protein
MHARAPWTEGLTAQQTLAMVTVGRFMALCCGRRAGKTVLLAALAASGLEDCEHDETVVYVARTRQVAKGLMWGKLKALARQYDLAWRFNEAELKVYTPSGGTLWLMGVDKPAEVEKARGLKMRLFLADEPATYPHVLEALMREIVEPALGDVRGRAVIAGTPGAVCAGYWWEVCTGKRAKWRSFSWTIRENPFFPDADAYLAEVLADNGWDEDNPTYRREYLGEWFQDDEALVFRVLPERNVIERLPDHYDLASWVHSIGIDYGLRDETAWTVMASHPHERDTYTLYSAKEAGLLQDDAADRTRNLVDRYNPDVLVGDAGGLGAPYIEAYNRRHPVGIRQQNADKQGKRAHVDMLNTELRAGRHRIVKDTCQPLLSEVYVLPWNEQRTEADKRFANHCSDSWLYDFTSHSAYMHEAPDSGPDLRDPDVWAAWQEQREVDELDEQLSEPDWARH